MLVRLEHANLCVHDFEAIVRFLKTAFPVFRVRGEGVSGKGARWLHIGTDETYIALMQAKRGAERPRPYTGVPGVNHLTRIFHTPRENNERDRRFVRLYGYQRHIQTNARRQSRHDRV